MMVSVPKTEAELKAAITKLEIETGEGLWKSVTFEELTPPDGKGKGDWYAESGVGSGVRDILYVGIEGLQNYYKELLEYQKYLKKKAEGPPDLGPSVAKYQNKKES